MIKLDEVVQKMLVDHRLNGFTVMGSWRGVLYQTVIITNTNISLWISYDERDRWLEVSWHHSAVLIEPSVASLGSATTGLRSEIPPGS